MIKNEILQNNFSTNSTSTTVMIESHSSLLASDDMKPTTEQLDGSSKQLSKHPIQFTPETLRTHLEPIIHNMVAWEDSYPFRQPVDPVALNILDYPTINKHIMNISTMHNKLLRGEYKNPLQFYHSFHFSTNSSSTTVMIESHSQSLTNGDMKAATTEQIDASSKKLLKHPVQFFVNRSILLHLIYLIIQQ
ncbi:unnamed protein product [Rotaria sp. Silwood2]|nr:unnamed protein product [Rotaria sp. Silwood2]